jgi:hypothetical protein
MLGIIAILGGKCHPAAATKKRGTTDYTDYHRFFYGFDGKRR